MSVEADLREGLVLHGRSLYERGLSPGSSGNLSVRLDDGLLVTPTGSCLGRLDPGRISRLDAAGATARERRPRRRPSSTSPCTASAPGPRRWCTCTAPTRWPSCLDRLDPADVLPPITPYGVMKIGRLPLVPYHRPGDRALADAVAGLARGHRALLLANHGPVVSAGDLDDAVAATEELEETARLFFLLRGSATRLLTGEQVRELREAFPELSRPMEEHMFVVTVRFQIKPGQEDDFHAAVLDQARNSLRLEPDCHQFDVCRHPENAGRGLPLRGLHRRGGLRRPPEDRPLRRLRRPRGGHGGGERRSRPGTGSGGPRGA